MITHAIDKLIAKPSTLEEPKLETRVLMPQDLNLVVTPRPLPPLDQLVPTEDLVCVCAIRKVHIGEKFLPLSGTVRTDRLPILQYLPSTDIRTRYGGFDTVNHYGRICNWVRFLKVSDIREEINLLGYRNGQETTFEVIKEIPAGGELVAYINFDTDAPQLYLPALQLLSSYNSYRQSLENFMSDKPLDLSRSLVSQSSGRNSPKGQRKSQNTSLSSDNDEISSDSSPIPSPMSSPDSISPVYSSNSSPVQPPLFSSPNLFTSAFTPRPPGTLFPPAADFQFGGPQSLLARMSGFPQPLSPPESDDGNKPSLQTSVIPVDTTKRRTRTMLKCTTCFKQFDRPSLLKRHVRTHTGEKPHVCDICGKGFSTSSSLNTHRRIHSGEKPHQCGVCGKRFTASSNLYYHKLTHSKDKPHKCNACPRSFPTPGDLRSHTFVHTGQYPHKCDVCGKGFSKQNNLRNHALLHTAKARLPRPRTPPSPMAI